MILVPPERVENPPPYALLMAVAVSLKTGNSPHEVLVFIFTPEVKFASYITGVVKHGGL
tara:strand:+ start:346 stop:522 length:177 start_codon:yes stop_codon:yes gene_type:complete